MPKAKKASQSFPNKPLEDSAYSSKSSNPTTVIDRPPSPTPNTNRRILHDVAASAEGIQLIGRGENTSEIDEIDPHVVKKEANEWVERNLSNKQDKLVEEAGVSKFTRQEKVTAAAGRESDGNENQEGVLQEHSNKNKRSSSTEEVVRGSSKEKKRRRDEARRENLDKQQDQELQIDWNKKIDYPWDCDEIRRKIKSFIEQSGMKVTDFQRTIRTNSTSYDRFIKLHGPWLGQTNSTFDGATRFFKACEVADLPMYKKPKVIQGPVVTLSSNNSDHPDISDIHLDGEDTDSVPVFDSCNEIRRKISAHLRKPGAIQAQFLRDISAQIHTPPQPVSIKAKQLRDFQTKRGPLAGNTSRVYYGAYVYFEKRRIKEGKDKSKHRLEMEKRWRHQGGVNIKRLWGRAWVRKGEVPTWDKYGTLHILGRRPRSKR